MILPIDFLGTIEIWYASLKFVPECRQKPAEESLKKLNYENKFSSNLWKGCLVTMNLTDDSSSSIVLICFFLMKGAACLAC